MPEAVSSVRFTTLGSLSDRGAGGGGVDQHGGEAEHGHQGEGLVGDHAAQLDPAPGLQLALGRLVVRPSCSTSTATAPSARHPGGRPRSREAGSVGSGRVMVTIRWSGSSGSASAPATMAGTRRNRLNAAMASTPRVRAIFTSTSWP